jgi:hypothetical protein
MQCPDDFVSCAPCFAKLVSHHPRHQFFRGTPSGDLEVNLLGMQHAICEGCGLAVGGLTWTCECISIEPGHFLQDMRSRVGDCRPLLHV